jgi:hypothetical protein
MKTNKLVVLLSISLAVLGWSFVPNNTVETIEIGQRIPEAKMKLKDLAGNYVRLTQCAKKQGLIVVFSCNTCPFVIGGESFPGWERTYNEYAEMASSKDIGFVLINSNEAKRDAGDNIEDMITRAKEKEYSMPYLLDAKSKVADAFGAKTTPHVFMFNKNMELVYKGSIDNSWDTKREKEEFYLREAVQEMLMKKTISVPSTPPRGCSIKRK